MKTHRSFNTILEATSIITLLSINIEKEEEKNKKKVKIAKLQGI